MKMIHFDDDLSHAKSRLRTPTLKNIQEDLELVHRGILDEHSFFSGYHFENHPTELLVHDKNGNLKYVRRSHNLRTNAGGHDEAQAISIGAASGAQYIGLSAATFVPNTTDNTLQGEITTGGLQRVSATFAFTNDPETVNPSQTTTYQGAYKLTATWTSTSVVNGIQACGVFNAVTSGDLWFESVFGAVNVQSGDTVTLSYTINY